MGSKLIGDDLFSVPSQEWLQNKRGELRTAARAAYRVGLTSEQFDELARRVSGQFPDTTPTAAGGDDGITTCYAEVNSLPDAVPSHSFDPAPVPRVLVRFAVRGDVALLTLRPCKASPDLVPAGFVVEGGAAVLLPFPVRSTQIEKWAGQVERTLALLKADLFHGFFSGTFGTPRELFREWNDKERAAAERAAEATAGLSSLPYPVVAPATTTRRR